jgi:N-acyl-D-aspartate/D-glutamate deacylase
MGTREGYDLVVRGGIVVDGTGADPMRADVAIHGSTIAEVGIIRARGRQEISAEGAFVTPGWIDMHTHYDGALFWDKYLTPSCWNGVTTTVIGNCGVGFAPVSEDGREILIDLMEGVEDIPGATLREGMPWSWESFPDFLDEIARLPHALDIGAFVPHSPVRCYVMGDRGAVSTEYPLPDELERMGVVVSDAMLAGALGLSTSLTIAHKSATGRSVPTLHATREELVALAGAVGRTGQGVLQVTSDFIDDHDMLVFNEMARVSGRPLMINVAQRPRRPLKDYRRQLEAMEAAAASGLCIRGQIAPRPVGVMLSVGGRRDPLTRSATYRRLSHLSVDERLPELRTRETRAAILRELYEGDQDAFIAGVYLGSYAFEMTDPPRYDYSTDEDLRARATRENCSVIELVYDALTTREPRGLIYAPGANFEEGNFEVTREMLVHPMTLPALGDAGAHMTTNCDHSFPTYLLTYWGRDAPEDSRLPLAWLVMKQTSEPAELLGLSDRGVVGPGYKADLNVLNMDSLAITFPAMVNDLPAGGRRLIQRSSGYRTTIVSGVPIQHDGELTGETPGGLIRGRQTPRQ